MSDSLNNPRPVRDAELAEWQSTVGRNREQFALADTEVLRRFALAAGLNPDVEKTVPMLAHWALFFDAVADERIGLDGHPQRGDFLPAIHLARRMFAASTMTFFHSLALGENTRCVSTILSVEHKRGRSGDLVFINVLREVFQGERLCTSEEQSLVYRPDGGRTAVVDVASPAPRGDAWTPGPVQLFRFSAVTYNSHRIHYDLPYSQAEEGYPNLVVHGPFTAVKLLNYACLSTGRTPRTFSFRGVAPMFVSQPIFFSGSETENSYTAIRCDGVTGMTANIEFD